MARSKHYLATPPGFTIKEQLEDREMTQKEFAIRMGLSEKHVSRLINGEVQLTPEMAVRLEYVLGVPASFWTNLEAIYREKLAKVEEENTMDADIELMRKLPYAEMANNQWIEKKSDPREKVVELRKYFEVVDLSLIINSKLMRIACRRLADTEKADYALIAWAQKAKLEARRISTKEIDIKTLRSILPDIRMMTTLASEEFCPKLVSMLSDCGIALVFLPHIGGSFLHGATFYDGNKIVIGLTVRGKDADRFWFSLFHELSHILKNDIAKPEGTSEDDEKQADTFARDTLIPYDAYDAFARIGRFDERSIIEFAKEQRIAPYIVLGRLQKDKFVLYSQFQHLKVKYEIA